jgi:hypothetical protein
MHEQQIELGLVGERASLALHMLAEHAHAHAHALTMEQRGQLNQAAQIFIDADMALRGFVRIESN